MRITLGRPSVTDLEGIIDELRRWNVDGAPFQLHPGDIGWFWRLGPDATAAGLRTWSVDGALVAVGLLDGADVLRLGLAPGAHSDADLARNMVADVNDPDHGVLPPGPVSVESPPGARIEELLGEEGWIADDPWTVLRCDLTQALPAPGVPVEVIEAYQAHEWCAVHRAAFGDSMLTPDEVLQRWNAMAAGMPYADARCLLAYTEAGDAAAAVIVWSAGPGRYGLIEPMGTHRDHRGHGYGTAITRAAARELQTMGCSAALVATVSSNVGGVATYTAAGFEKLSERRDRRRMTSR